MNKKNISIIEQMSLLENIKNRDMIYYLIDNLENLHEEIIKTENNGDNSFILSCRFGYSEIVKKFLELGNMAISDIIHQNNLGETALSWACCNNHLEIVKEINIFLNHENEIKNNILLQDCKGDTCLIWACRFGHLEIVKELLNVGNLEKQDIIQPNKDGNTAFIWAARNGYLEIVTELINKGDLQSTDIIFKNKFSSTAFSWATRNGHSDIVKLLIYHLGTNFANNILIKNIEGNTALHWASKNGHKSIILEFVKTGLKKEIILLKNNDGQSAIDLSKNEEIKNLLLSSCYSKQLETYLLEKDYEEVFEICGIQKIQNVSNMFDHQINCCICLENESNCASICGQYNHYYCLDCYIYYYYVTANSKTCALCRSKIGNNLIVSNNITFDTML